MGRRGRKRQLGVEDEYWSLILDGVGTVEACRRVGITRKTGYRWRAERGGLPPLRLREDARTSRYLSRLERERIAVLRGQGMSVRQIARRLARAPSTISREVRRNMRPHDGDVYDAVLAHARARAAARRVRGGRIAGDPALRELVQAKLKEAAWEHVIPFFEFPPEVRKVIYTTNMIESINYQLRKITKTRGHFPTDEALIKLLYLGCREIGVDHTRQTAGRSLATGSWRTALNQFDLMFPGRLDRA